MSDATDKALLAALRGARRNDDSKIAAKMLQYLFDEKLAGVDMVGGLFNMRFVLFLTSAGEKMLAEKDATDD